MNRIPWICGKGVAMRIAFIRTGLVLLLALGGAVHAGEIQTRVFGGKDAPASEWPWMAAILDKSKADDFQAQFCGGTLIAPNWILSAAHCFQPKEDSENSALTAGDIAVLLDTIELSTTSQSPSRRAVERILIHPGWSRDSATNNSDDIALLQLQNPATLPTASVIDSARSAALPDSGNDGVEILGWGAVAPDTSTDGDYWFDGTLQQVALDFLPLAQCKNHYNDDSLFSDSMICAYEPDAATFEADDEGDTSPDDPNSGGDTAGEDTFGEDSCAGDSGGPLFVEQTHDWLAGITSFGAECGDASFPGVYTEALDYVGWLEGQTAAIAPVADITGELSASPRYAAIGTTLTIQADLKNNAVANDATNARATLDPGASAIASDASGGDGLDCTGTTTLTCTGDNPLAAQTVNQGAVDIQHDGTSREVVTIVLTSEADEGDYRNGNDRVEQDLIFSDEPDITLTFGSANTSKLSASLPLTVANTATHRSASDISFTLNLPSAITLDNADTLNCNGHPPVCTPGDDLPAGSDKQYSLELSADSTGTHDLSATGESADGDFPNADPDASTSISLGTSGGSSSNDPLGEDASGIGAGPGLILVLAYIRRKNRSRS